MTVSYVTLDTLAMLESISLCRPLRPAASDRVVASIGSTSCWWSANQRIAIAVRQIRSANHSQCTPRSSLVNVCNFCAPSSDIASPSASMLATGCAGYWAALAQCCLATQQGVGGVFCESFLRHLTRAGHLTFDHSATLLNIYVAFLRWQQPHPDCHTVGFHLVGPDQPPSSIEIRGYIG